MLLRNESTIEHFVHLRLAYDDCTIKELNLFEGDCVKIKYIKDGCCKCTTGIVKRILPYNTRRTPCKCRKESAMITIDSSEDFNYSIDEFDTQDIIDIEKVDTCCHCCYHNMPEPIPPVEEETPVEPPVVDPPVDNETTEEEETNG